MHVSNDGMETISLRVCEEGRQIVNAVVGRAKVVTVAGINRSGKSFLSNALYGQNGVFEHRSGFEACTKGSDIVAKDNWIQVDAEGMWNGSAAYDLQHLATLLLISDVFIVNHLGPITADSKFKNQIFVSKIHGNFTTICGFCSHS